MGSGLKKTAYVILGMNYLLTSALKNKHVFIDTTIYDEHGTVKECSFDSCSGLLFSNISSYAGGGRLPSDVRCDDGILEGYVFPSMLSYSKFMLQGRIGGLVRNFPRLWIKRALLHIRAEVPVQLDGEWIGSFEQGTTVDIQRIRAMPVLIPPDDFLVRDGIDSKKSFKLAIKEDGSSAVPGPATMKYLVDP